MISQGSTSRARRPQLNLTIVATLPPGVGNRRHKSSALSIRSSNGSVAKDKRQPKSSQIATGGATAGETATTAGGREMRRVASCRTMFETAPAFISARRDFQPYDPPKLREGVCKMCKQVKLIRDCPPELCEECWEFNKDL